MRSNTPMNIAKTLSSMPLSFLTIDQVVALHWQDGPMEGVVRMATPKCEFSFDLFAERYNPDGLDDRLFSLRHIPDGSVTRILMSIQGLGRPSSTVWAPIWRFPTESMRSQADNIIDQILKSAVPTNLIAYSTDWRTILGVWQIDCQVGPQDWFSKLRIP